MDQLLHRKLDWKGKQCFQDQILSNQKQQQIDAPNKQTDFMS